jgi:tetratricopeptide (TPR) repeat protein
MLIMDPYLLLLLIGCLFILVFGGLSWLRREGLSLQFALESIGLMAIIGGGAWVLRQTPNPFLFLALLYLITMRSRLLVEVANFLARRERYETAFGLYRLGLALWPDDASRLIVLTNQGAAELCNGQIEAATRTLESVLREEDRPRLGFKYEAAGRYNLGLAYEKSGETAKATRQYNEVLDLLPGSAYGQAAKAALKRLRGGSPDA